MDFSLTEEHLMIRDAARDFAQTELLHGVIERDNTQTFPDELVRKMGELGFMGIMVDPKSGLIDMKAFSKLLHDIEFDGWVIVEQDMYPVPFDQPYVIAKRTKKYLTEIGID